MSKIAVVGSGLMGHALIGAFMKAGHAVTIVDKNPEAAWSLIENGAGYRPFLGEALDCDFVVLNLPNYKIAAQFVDKRQPAVIKEKIEAAINLLLKNQDSASEAFVLKSGL